MRRQLFVPVVLATIVATLAISSGTCHAQAGGFRHFKAKSDIPVKNIPADATDIKVSVKGYDEESGDFAEEVPGSLFRFDVAKKALTVDQPGIYLAEITSKTGMTDNAPVRMHFVVDVAQKVADATPKSGLSIGGGLAEHDDLKAKLNISDKSFRQLVVELAKEWPQTVTDNSRKEYVARYDYTPVDTCRQIAAIFRDAKTKLDSSDVDAANQELSTRFEQFYAGGKRQYRTINPLVEDWQPFLRTLRTEVMKQIPETRKNDKDFLKVVLEDLAQGFDDLAAIHLGATTGGAQMQPGGSSGQAGGMADDNCRRRRRCRCSSLLFR